MFRFMVTEFIADLPKWNDSSQMNLSNMMPQKGQVSRVITCSILIISYHQYFWHGLLARPAGYIAVHS